MMHPIIGGAAARPFITHHNALDMELYLRIAPELYLKRLVVGGFERVYEINRNFRNEGLSRQHNPEFTMLEFYQAYATYTDLMDLTEAMVGELAREVERRARRSPGTAPRSSSPRRGAACRSATRCASSAASPRPTACSRIPAFAAEVAIAPACPRPTSRASCSRASHRGRSTARRSRRSSRTRRSVPWRRGADRALSHDRSARVRAGHLGYLVFEATAEAKLVQPTFLTEFPLAVSPLARKNDQDPAFCDRFELFVNGKEIANGFSELNDPDDQRARFQAQVRAKAAGADETMDYDEDYCRALEVGMPPTAGEGIGIDRLAMLLTGQASIRDVILFPLMRAE